MAGDTLVIETNGGQVLELPRQTAQALLRAGFAKRAPHAPGGARAYAEPGRAWAADGRTMELIRVVFTRDGVHEGAPIAAGTTVAVTPKEGAALWQSGSATPADPHSRALALGIVLRGVRTSDTVAVPMKIRS